MIEEKANRAVDREFSLNHLDSGRSPFRAPAERLGVGVYIIQDGRLRCGRISACPYIEAPEQCMQSGGTTFIVRFPRRESSREEEHPPGEPHRSG
ncbi:MAG: hypothetical protein K9M82_10650 [Deltaproteobacteria bacterium]|nr:hypothetical protein [Deltaproteobacteria bacterium]